MLNGILPSNVARILGGLLVAIVIAGCGGGGTTPATASSQQASLYDRLGGKDAITLVVDEFVANVAADERVNARFANTDIPAFKAKLVDQICEATGGPCTYTGLDMLSAHRGMGITEAEFNAIVEDLVAALDTYNVPEQEKGELLSALAGMKSQIVGV